MENSFFSSRCRYQQPDQTRYPFSHSLSFHGMPIYRVSPTGDTHRPGHPIQSPSERNQAPKVVQIPVRFVGSKQTNRSGAALKIQKVFRGFLVRKYLKKIDDIKIQVDEIEERLLKSEVVELARRDERERLKMNESLMSLLFKLDSICGLDFGVRGYRKAVIQKVIALQERIDSIVDIDLQGNDGSVDQETEIRVSVEVESSNQSDDPVKANAGSLDCCVEYDEILRDASCGRGEDDKSMEVDVIDVPVDREVKVSEANCVENDGESLSEGDGKDKMTSYGVEVGKPKGGYGEDDDKRNRELVERMMEDKEKVMSLMMQLLERNESQTRMLNALTQRVELLEKAFVCDMLRKRKKKGIAECR